LAAVCSFVVWRRGCAQVATRVAHLRSSSNSRMPERHSGDAGATPADRSIFNETHNVYGGRQLAQPGLQNLACSVRHRDAVPISNRGVARRKGNGLISRPRAGSLRGREALLLSRSGCCRLPEQHIPAPPPINLGAARSFRRSPALQAGEHGAKPWRSTNLRN
jgi:hypothetical protein